MSEDGYWNSFMNIFVREGMGKFAVGEGGGQAMREMFV